MSITNAQLAIILGSIAGALSLVVCAVGILCVVIYILERDSTTEPCRPYDPYLSSSHYGPPSKRPLRRSRKQDPLAQYHQEQFSDEEAGNEPDPVGDSPRLVTGQEQVALAPPPQENNPTPTTPPPGEAEPPTPPTANNNREFQPPQRKEDRRSSSSASLASRSHRSYASRVPPPQADMNNAVSPTPTRPTQHDAMPTQPNGPIQQLNAGPAREEPVRHSPPGSRHRPETGKIRFFSPHREELVEPTTPPPQLQYVRVPTPSPRVSPPTVVPRGDEEEAQLRAEEEAQRRAEEEQRARMVEEAAARMAAEERDREEAERRRLAAEQQKKQEEAEELRRSEYLRPQEMQRAQAEGLRRSEYLRQQEMQQAQAAAQWQEEQRRAEEQRRYQQRRQLEQLVEEVENESFTENLSEYLHEIENESTRAEEQRRYQKRRQLEQLVEEVENELFTENLSEYLHEIEDESTTFGSEARRG